jgi:hypothetical protein
MFALSVPWLTVIIFMIFSLIKDAHLGHIQADSPTR